MTQYFIFGSLLIVFLISPSLASDNWPEYRGPTHNGHSSVKDLPLNWSESKNIKWKTPIHGRAWSSPVVMGNQVWVTTATEDGKEMFAICVDRDSGKILLDRKVFDVKMPRTLGNEVNTYASPSPVIESGRVYVHFGSYGTACLDTKTFKTIWERRDLPCDHHRGPASSPILFEDLIILHFDGSDVQYVAALDKMTGDTRWVNFRSTDYNDLEENGRPVASGDLRKSYNTAFVIDFVGKKQLISPSAKAAYSYDPRTGKEFWQVRHAGHSSAARTVYGNGVAYINTGFPTELLAVRVDGRGDVTGSHIKWKAAKSICHRSSPLLIDGFIYMISNNGIASCLDVKTSKTVWQKRIGGNFSASMVHADNKIYLFDEDGVTTILKLGKTPEILTTNKLDDGFMASPAIAGKALFLRTKTQLYCISDV